MNGVCAHGVNYATRRVELPFTRRLIEICGTDAVFFQTKPLAKFSIDEKISVQGIMEERRNLKERTKRAR